MVATITDIRSIQGERVGLGHVRADMATVEAYVETAEEGVLACRETGRHTFPPARIQNVRFTSVDNQGRFVWEEPCKCCGKVKRIEKWESVGRGTKLRWHRVDRYLSYSAEYLMEKGEGRMAPSQIQEASMCVALRGLSVKDVMAKMLKEHAG